MILFKACPRCEGDVDSTYGEDVYCVQCGYRPRGLSSGPQLVKSRLDQARLAARWSGRRASDTPGDHVAEGITAGEVLCAKCGSEKLISLDKFRYEDNTCYRCRSCGHIFSPRVLERPGQRGVALP